MAPTFFNRFFHVDSNRLKNRPSLVIMNGSDRYAWSTCRCYRYAFSANRPPSPLLIRQTRVYGGGRALFRDFRIHPTTYALHSNACTFVWLIDDRRTLLCVYRTRSGPKSLTGGRNTRRFSRKTLGTVYDIYSPTSRRRRQRRRR